METKDKIKPQHLRFIERVGQVFLLDLILFKLKSELLVCIVSSVGARLILKVFFHFSRRICVSYIAY